MSIIDERLKQIAELEQRVQDKIDWIKEKRAELEEMTDLISKVPQDMKDMMSNSASRSSVRRGQGETIGIDESATRDEEILANLREAIAEAEEELEVLNKEKQDLEDYVKGN